MTIYEVLKVFATPNKAKIVAHFWSCTCDQGDCVTEIARSLRINQSNLSKHFAHLKSVGMLSARRINKHKYYAINDEFKKKWSFLIEQIVTSDSLVKFACPHCQPLQGVKHG